MKATRWMGLCFFSAFAPLASYPTVGWAAEPTSVGPPAFVTLPIHAAEQLEQRVQGWLTFPVEHKPTSKPGGGPPGGGTGGGGGGVTPGVANFSLSKQSSFPEVNTLANPRPYQGETAMAFAPVSGLLVGGFNSIDPGNCSASLANCAPGAVSLNITAGTGWQQSNVRINGNLIGYDPSLAVDADGTTIYYAYGVCSGSCRNGNLLVATSTNGVTWSDLGIDVTPPLSGIFDDKPWIAADPKTPRIAYVAWDRNQGNDQILYVSKTIDGGTTWSSPPVKINDGTTTHERVIYAMPAVSPKDGTVYVVWMDYARKALFVDKSTDGVNWGTDQQVAALNVTFTDIGCNGGRSMTPAPYIAVDTGGRVYVTYADELKGGNGMDVYLVYNNNDGNGWKGPYRINDNIAGHQYNPAMNVVGTTVYVSWLDRRNDPNNCKTQTFSTYSDGTLTSGVPNFSPNHNVSDNTVGTTGSTANQSDYDGNPNGPGDYSGVVGGVPATGGGVAAEYPLWTTHFANADHFGIDTAEVQP